MSGDSLENVKNGKDDKGRNEKALQELMAEPANTLCADCGARGPRWASYNLGVFLCIRCGGLHRRLGTHISKVRSLTLDTWTWDQIQSLKQWGNARANAHYNPRPELFTLPASDSGMEQFIRDKYERKILLLGDASTSQFRVGPAAVTPPGSARNTVTSIVRPHVQIHQFNMQKLAEMGFKDPTLCHRALKHANDDIYTAIEWMGQQQQQQQQAPLNPEAALREKLDVLHAMGYTDEAACRQTLQRCPNGTVEEAAALMAPTRRRSSGKVAQMSASIPQQQQQQQPQQPPSQTTAPTVQAVAAPAVPSKVAPSAFDLLAGLDAATPAALPVTGFNATAFSAAPQTVSTVQQPFNAAPLLPEPTASNKKDGIMALFAQQKSPQQQQMGFNDMAVQHQQQQSLLFNGMQQQRQQQPFNTVGMNVFSNNNSSSMMTQPQVGFAAAQPFGQPAGQQFGQPVAQPQQLNQNPFMTINQGLNDVQGNNNNYALQGVAPQWGSQMGVAQQQQQPRSLQQQQQQQQPIMNGIFAPTTQQFGQSFQQQQQQQPFVNNNWSL